MTEFIRRKIKAGAKTKLKKFVKGSKDRMKSGDLGKAFKKGDEVAVAAVEHSARYCGIAIANLFNILSPELFVIGGGVIVNLGADYIKMVQKVADKYAYTTDLAGIKIVQATLGDDSGVLGSAIAARERL